MTSFGRSKSLKTADTMYAKLTAVITAAVGVVVMMFTLFNSVLRDLMPDVEGAAQTVNFVSFGTVIVLLALTLLIRKRLSKIGQYVWALAAITFLAVAVITYFSFGDLVRKHVYLYPPATGAPGLEQRPLVSGPYHERGREKAANMDVATAVSKFGGPAVVNGHQLLWTAESRSDVVGKFVRFYAAIAFLMATALFVAAIAVWRTLRDRVDNAKRPGG